MSEDKVSNDREAAGSRYHLHLIEEVSFPVMAEEILEETETPRPVWDHIITRSSWRRSQIKKRDDMTDLGDNVVGES